MSGEGGTQTWWVQGRILGSAPIGLEYTCAQRHKPWSMAYCCPVCGEVWARRIISPSTKWFFWTMCCAKCKDKNPNRLHTPGSIILPGDREFLDNLPHFMLAYEARNCCEFWGY